MPKTRPTMIWLKKGAASGTHEELRAAATITPGMLLDTNSAGSAIPHGTAGGRAENMFALEDALQGRTIDDDYASGELVQVGIARSGDVVFGWLNTGEQCSPDDFLASNGDGTLRVVTGSDNAIGKALEAIDLTDTGAENGRVRVRIL